MADEPDKILGISNAEWQAAFEPHVRSQFATRWVVTNEGGYALRIAFGNFGSLMDDGTRRGTPVYQTAVVLPPEIARSLGEFLLRNTPSLDHASFPGHGGNGPAGTA